MITAVEQVKYYCKQCGVFCTGANEHGNCNTTVCWNNQVKSQQLHELFEINKENFGTLCICAIRYCHGRRTYMSSLVMEIVGKHLSELSDRDIKVMYDDCRFMNLSDYGDEVIDKPNWLLWEKKLKKELERREDGEEWD